MTEPAVRQEVRARASERCEYCRLPESATEVTFHVEHVIAKQHGGQDVIENLALACDRCNLFKGPNLSGIDPLSHAIVPLFHPRNQTWDEHFAVVGATIEGRTPIGRATVLLLQMNAPARVKLRRSVRP